MAWEKVKIYYKNTLSGLVATNTAVGDYDVANLLDWREGTWWKALDTTDPMYITFDAGVGNTYVADYLGISGHNFNTIGATVSLEYSTDNFVGDINEAVSVTPSNNLQFVATFTQQDKRSWRIKIVNQSAAPKMEIAVWGEGVELDYATILLDPNAEKYVGDRFVTQGGVIAGNHERYTRREIDLIFEGAEDTLYQKIKTWWETSGMGNFFISWEPNEHSTETYLVAPTSDYSFKNPLTRGGQARTINLPLVGRKE